MNNLVNFNNEFISISEEQAIEVLSLYVNIDFIFKEGDLTVDNFEAVHILNIKEGKIAIDQFKYLFGYRVFESKLAMIIIYLDKVYGALDCDA